MAGLRILAISGSLRRVSSNTELLRAAVALAPADMVIELYDGLDRLPHFNADIEPETSAPVVELKTRLSAADGLLISTPEYARGVPGSLKNALDWLVSGPEFVDKPVALLSASTRSLHAYEALKLTLTTMSGRMVPDASITVPLLGRNLDAAGIVADAELAGPLRAALVAFASAIAHPSVAD
jgi:chromate reductase, NAD(P)H dehydrogenase (quinone)